MTFNIDYQDFLYSEKYNYGIVVSEHKLQQSNSWYKTGHLKDTLFELGSDKKEEIFCFGVFNCLSNLEDHGDKN